MKKLAMLLVVLLAVTLTPPQRVRSAAPSTLWLSNDNAGSVFETDIAGTVLNQLPATPATGIAFDGTHIYIGDGDGNISQRNPDGTPTGTSLTIPPVNFPAEDLAWDSTRSRLWRVDHSPPTLRRIDLVAGAVEVSYPLPETDPDPELTPRGALGLAYDTKRDVLYVSFCLAGCINYNKGVMLSVDPATGAVTGELFRTTGITIGGLGYDPITDTLWVGEDATVRNVTLGGTVLSSFNHPQPGRFVDGLEFIPAPPACDMAQTASYSGGDLTLMYTFDTTVPVTWNLYMVIGNSVFTAISAPVGVTYPPVSIGPLTFPFPALGGVGFLTTMTTATGGILCSDFDVVHTGTATAARPTAAPHLPIPSLNGAPAGN